MPGPTTFVDRITSKIGDTIGLNTTQPRRRSAGFDINEFLGNIGTYGILPNNLFLVSIIPNGGSGASEMASAGLSPQSLSFFCLKAELPGVQIEVDQNKPSNIGPIENFPVSATIAPITLEFIGDSKARILSFFQNWMNKIIPFDGRKKYDGYFKAAYQNTYLANISILLFNQQSDKIMEYQLQDCFPLTLYPTPLSWEPQNDFMRIVVEFSVKTWSSNLLSTNYNLDTNPGLTTLQKLMKLGTVAQTVMAIRKPQNIQDSINLLNNANVIGGGLTNFF